MKKCIILGIAILFTCQPLMSSERPKQKKLTIHYAKSKINTPATLYGKTPTAIRREIPYSDNASAFFNYNTIPLKTTLQKKDSNVSLSRTPTSEKSFQITKEESAREQATAHEEIDIAMSAQQKAQLIAQAQARIKNMQARLEDIKQNRADYNNVWSSKGVITIEKALIEHKDRDLCYIDWIGKCVPISSDERIVPFLSLAQTKSFLAYAKQYMPAPTGPLLEDDAL